MNDRRASFGQPLVNFSKPVGLHHIGNNHQERESACCFRSYEGLSRLAKTRLIREQKASVTAAHGLHKLRLVHHKVQPTWRGQVCRCGQFHAGHATARALLKGSKQRLHQLPVQKAPLYRSLGLLIGSKIGGHKWVGKLCLAHRGRNDLFGSLRAHLRGFIHDDEVIGIQFLTRGNKVVTTQFLGGFGHFCVRREQLNQAGVSCCCFRHDGGKSIQTLQRFLTLRDRERCVFFGFCSFLTNQQRGDLKLDPVSCRHFSATRSRLHFPHSPRQDRNDALIIDGLLPSPLSALWARPGARGACLGHSSP